MATEYTKIGRIRPVFKGQWDSAAEYTILDIVYTADGSRAYAAVKDVPAGTALTDAECWQPVVDMSAALARVEQAEEKAAAAESVTNGKASAIVSTASGEEIAVSDASDMILQGLRVFGKTAQDGTPAPDAPVDLANAGGDGSIAVNIQGGEADAQSLALSIPGGLPGIPVSSGGNYIDANGQQWVCDEIDLERGMYVQRVGAFAAVSSLEWYVGPMNADAPGNISRYALNGAVAANVVTGSAVTFAGFCSHLVPVSANAGFNGNAVGVSITASGMLNFYTEHASKSAFLAWLDAQHSAGTPVTVYYILPVSAETPLDAAQIAAYAALHTNKPSTTITNDSGAGMQVDYVADTRLYIDNKFAQLAANA